MQGAAGASQESGGLQTFRERLPASGLRRYITCVWIQQVLPDSIPYAHRTVPNGSAELVCEFGAVPKIVGPQTGPTEEVLAPGTTVVGVRFRPGAVRAVLGVPAYELLDLAVGADELWGDTAVALGEEAAGSASPHEFAATLEAEIFGRVSEQSPLDAIAAEAVRRLLPGRMTDVSSLASSLFISERQLRRRCEAAVGVAPKALQRMLRFQGFLALTRYHNHPRRALSVLAAEAGYADQSHLSREAQRLTGRSPRVLLREAEHYCAGAHDHAASYGPLLGSRALARTGSTVL